MCTCMPCFPSSSEIGSTTQFQQRANYLYAAQGDRAIQAHTSSEVQKQPRSHGTHCNNSKQYDSASASKAFVSATGLLCLCAGSQGDACDHDHNFHILCVQVKKHIVGSHPVTVHIPMWQQRSSTATKKARINKKKTNSHTSWVSNPEPHEQQGIGIDHGAISNLRLSLIHI